MKITIEIDGQPHTVELSDEDVRALNEIAALNGISLETALARAIRDERFIAEEERSGGRLLVERNHKLTTLVRAAA